MKCLSQSFLVCLAVLACNCACYDLPPRSARSCSISLDTEAQTILAQQGVAGASTFFPAGEAEAQQARYPGTLCPSTALLRAVTALLGNSDPESLVMVRKAVGQPECDAQCYFNRDTSLLGIVADHRSKLSSQLLPLPPASYSVAEHWIFFLAVPDLGEHGYWALVARHDGSVQTIARN